MEAMLETSWCLVVPWVHLAALEDNLQVQVGRTTTDVVQVVPVLGATAVVPEEKVVLQVSVHQKVDSVHKVHSLVV